MIALRRGDVAAAAEHVAGEAAPNPQFAGRCTRGPRRPWRRPRSARSATVRLGVRGPPSPGLPRASGAPGLLLGDPATAAWLARTALAAGEHELAAVVAGAAEALAAGNPGYPAVTAAAAHSLGLAGRDPGRLAEAAAQQPDPWAQASAAEDLGVLHARQADRGRPSTSSRGPSRDTSDRRGRRHGAGPVPAPRARRAAPALDPVGAQAGQRVGKPDRRRTRRVRTGRRGTE